MSSMQSAIPLPEAKDKAQTQTVKALLALRELVLSGELVPGQRVSELVMVERIGVSRTPLRTAFVRLEGEGLLEALPSGGYTARHFSVQDVFATIEIRGAIEGLAARFAAERFLSNEALDPITQILTEIDELIAANLLDKQTFSDYVPLNEQFHDQLAKLSGSLVIEQQIERANAHPFASPSAFIDLQTQMADARKVLMIAQDQHHCVIEAIQAGEGGRAEALMREHARLAHRYLRKALDDRQMLAQVPGASLLRGVG